MGVAYAIGALAGLRTGEVRALDWSSIDLKAGPADVEGWRVSGSADTTVPGPSPCVLAQDRRRGGVGGQAAAPGREALPGRLHYGKFLRDVVKELHLEMKCSCCGAAVAWYEYTRHGYACHFIMAGGSIEELSRTTGHSTTAITQKHYVHLRPGYYTVSARNRLTADFGSDSVQTATHWVSAKARNRYKAA